MQLAFVHGKGPEVWRTTTFFLSRSKVSWTRDADTGVSCICKTSIWTFWWRGSKLRHLMSTFYCMRRKLHTEHELSSGQCCGTTVLSLHGVYTHKKSLLWLCVRFPIFRFVVLADATDKQNKQNTGRCFKLWSFFFLLKRNKLELELVPVIGRDLCNSRCRSSLTQVVLILPPSSSLMTVMLMVKDCST